jgi:hypothetical protein
MAAVLSDYSNEFWEGTSFRSYIPGVAEGKWMVFHSCEEWIIALYNEVSDLARTSKIDIPGIKRSTGTNPRASSSDWVLIVYTDGDERSKVNVGRALQELLAGKYVHKWIYWKSEEQTIQGTTATGVLFNSSDRISIPRKKVSGPTNKSACDNCGRRTRNKHERLGRCESCYVASKMICKSGNYTGKLYSEVYTISEPERQYGDMDQSELSNIIAGERDFCKLCYRLDGKMSKREIPCCWVCFQTGHVSYKSGKYETQSIMLILYENPDYEGLDLNDEDARFHLVGREQMSKYHEFREVSEFPSDMWRNYLANKSGRFDSIVANGATREHFRTRRPVRIEW